MKFANIRLVTKPVVGVFDLASNVTEGSINVIEIFHFGHTCAFIDFFHHHIILSSTHPGIRNTTTVFDANDIDRVRLPRYVGRDGILRVS